MKRESKTLDDCQTYRDIGQGPWRLKPDTPYYQDFDRARAVLGGGEGK